MSLAAARESGCIRKLEKRLSYKARFMRPGVIGRESTQNDQDCSRFPLALVYARHVHLLLLHRHLACLRELYARKSHYGHCRLSTRCTRRDRAVFRERLIHACSL